MIKVLLSRGFITPQQVARIAPKLGFPGATVDSMGSNIDHPFMQALIKAGYLGYRHGDAFTNWAMGEMPGMGLKLIEKSKPLEMIIDGVKNISGHLDGTYPEILKRANGGLVNIPKFKNGINVVPEDMLAMIHKNESIIPATMNPFNPEATMPRYNFNKSSFNVRGDGAIGASYTVNQNIYASEGMDVEALSNMIVKKAEVVIGQKAKINVKMVGQGKNI
jgi:hypothetical protein